MTTTDPLVDLIENTRLTPIQRRIAQRLIGHGPGAGHLSSGELAAIANVSQPSVSRFVRTLGFASFQDFSHFLRQRNGVALPERPVDVREDLNLYQHAVSAEIMNLERMHEGLADPAPLREIAEKLAASEPLVVVGLRASAGLAQTFGYFASILLPDVRVFTHFDSATQDSLEQSRMSGATWVVVLSLPRYPVETLAVARFAASVGFRILAITDSPYTELAEIADAKLIAPVGNQLVFDSHVVPTMLCMALLEAITDVSPGRTQHRLEAFEESVAERRIFTGP